MDGGRGLESLFQHASAYKFHDFNELFLELAPCLSVAERREALLLQAQIKLFAADETLLNDLEEASQADLAPRFPCLNDQWAPDSPNRFAVFKTAPGALQSFLQMLPQAGEYLKHWYGEAGMAMTRQIQSEILYFRGEFDDALCLVKEQRGKNRQPAQHATDTILSQYVQFRCCLAAGLQREAQECMLDMIRTAKNYPECIVPYRIIRDWANLTTGWSGDTPRFCQVSNGEAKPVLEDRLTAIRGGISRLSAAEEPFAQYAAHRHRETCTMRQYYMDIFHAIYWFQAEDHAQAGNHFIRAHQISTASGIVMPFAEYGRQIVPLLQYIGAKGTICPKDWIARILSLAEQYEENLQKYRA